MAPAEQSVAEWIGFSRLNSSPQLPELDASGRYTLPHVAPTASRRAFGPGRGPRLERCEILSFGPVQNNDRSLVRMYRPHQPPERVPCPHRADLVGREPHDCPFELFPPDLRQWRARRRA